MRVDEPLQETQGDHRLTKTWWRLKTWRVLKFHIISHEHYFIGHQKKGLLNEPKLSEPNVTQHRPVLRQNTYRVVTTCRPMGCQTGLVAVNKDQVQQAFKIKHHLYPSQTFSPCTYIINGGEQKSSFLWAFWFLCRLIGISVNMIFYLTGLF